ARVPRRSRPHARRASEGVPSNSVAVRGWWGGLSSGLTPRALRGQRQGKGSREGSPEGAFRLMALGDRLNAPDERVHIALSDRRTLSGTRAVEGTTAERARRVHGAAACGPEQRAAPGFVSWLAEERQRAWRVGPFAQRGRAAKLSDRAPNEREL